MIKEMVAKLAAQSDDSTAERLLVGGRILVLVVLAAFAVNGSLADAFTGFRMQPPAADAQRTAHDAHSGQQAVR